MSICDTTYFKIPPNQTYKWCTSYHQQIVCREQLTSKHHIPVKIVQKVIYLLLCGALISIEFDQYEVIHRFNSFGVV